MDHPDRRQNEQLGHEQGGKARISPRDEDGACNHVKDCNQDANVEVIERDSAGAHWSELHDRPESPRALSMLNAPCSVVNRMAESAITSLRPLPTLRARRRQPVPGRLAGQPVREAPDVLLTDPGCTSCDKSPS